MNVPNYLGLSRLPSLPEPMQGAGYYGDHRPNKKNGDEEEIDFWAIAQVVWRRKFRILLATFALTAVAGFFIFRLPPIFSAQSVVLTGQQPPSLMDLGGGVTAISTDSGAIESDVQLLSSTSFAEQTIDKLRLVEDAEFNPALRAPGLSLSSVLVALGLKTQAPLTEEEQRGLVLRSFQNQLTITPIGKSRAVRIAFESRSPVTASNVANTLAEIYQQRQVKVQEVAYDRAERWLTSRTREAEAHLAELQEKLSAARKASLSSDSALSASDEVLQSPLIQALRAQEAAARQRLAAAKASYGAEHPDVLAAQSELKSIVATIDQESAKILEQLTNDSGRPRAERQSAAVALAHIKKKRHGTEDLQEGSAETPDDTVGVLERKTAAEDAVYKSLLSRSKELEIQNGSQQAASEIISRADVPTNPFFPNIRLMVLLSFLVSLAATVTAAIMFERRSQTVTSSRQLEAWFGTAAVSLVPTINGGKPPTHGRWVGTDAGGQTMFHESIRTIHSKFLLAAGQTKTLMVASTVPGEGKTSVSVSLASLVASTGARAILIDCDLRKPRVHHALDLKPGPGLTEVLKGNASFSEAVRIIPDSGLAVITSGASDSHPASLLASSAMKDLLSRVAETYDIVIIDSPPVGAVSDALVLAPNVDSVLYLVRWGKTRQQLVARGMSQLTSAGARISGVVLSMVDIRRVMKERLDDYYDSGALDYARPR